MMTWDFAGQSAVGNIVPLFQHPSRSDIRPASRRRTCFVHRFTSDMSQSGDDVIALGVARGGAKIMGGRKSSISSTRSPDSFSYLDKIHVHGEGLQDFAIWSVI